LTAPVEGQLERELERAVAVLRAGGLVAFPTETVYGLGADAGNEAAVRRIFEVKGRPADHPLIVHLAAAEQLAAWASTVPVTARALADELWPGPLTLLLDRRPTVLDAVTGRRPTVGLRVPDQPLALELLGAFGEGVAAPSANRFGKVSPTTAEHVRGDLGADVDLVLDGGPCTVGVESTIVDCTTDPPTLLRPGGVSVDRLVEVLGSPVRTEAAGPSRAPGMMASHYAPRCRVEVVDEVAVAEERVAVLRSEGLTADLLAPSLGAEDYARHLYGWLRDADDRGLDVLVAVAPAGEGLGLAVRDRLTKAAAPRPTVEDAG
jgi:L-threonylcarbamoyladenylate synthase